MTGASLDIPMVQKTCECGCGQPAPIAKMTAKRIGHVKGQPVRFIAGHYSRTIRKQSQLNLCACGCGEMTKTKYVRGHSQHMRGGNLLDRFWGRVEKSSGCWQWCGALNTYGYGRVAWRGKSILAHRLSWMISNDSLIPAGMVVMHSCDNPACVNPDHLSLGTNQDNSDDKFRKNRMRFIGPKNSAKGERNAGAILKEIQVREIRKRLQSGIERRELATEFGVSIYCINEIAIGKTWKHVGAE